MKTIVKIMMMFAVLTITTSCTEQQRVRRYGGKMQVKLPKGEKLIMATWKESNLFYLTEQMDSSYIPKNKKFRESSNFGILQSEITFVESK